MCLLVHECGYVDRIFHISTIIETAYIAYRMRVILFQINMTIHI